MLSKEDYGIAIFTMGNMVGNLHEGLFTQEQFDRELANYTQFLLDKGMTVEQLDSIFKVCKMDIEINVHEIE